MMTELMRCSINKTLIRNYFLKKILKIYLKYNKMYFNRSFFYFKDLL